MTMTPHRRSNELRPCQNAAPKARRAASEASFAHAADAAPKARRAASEASSAHAEDAEDAAPKARRAPSEASGERCELRQFETSEASFVNPMFAAHMAR